eukprot:2510462-Prymnesium_polylepis.1
MECGPPRGTRRTKKLVGKEATVGQRSELSPSKYGAAESSGGCCLTLSRVPETILHEHLG